MTPKTAVQFAGIREERKSQLMQTALSLFANQGYHNTTIQQIAAVAGISKGLMYNYFKSKEDLLIQLVETGLGDMIRQFEMNQNEVPSAHQMEQMIRTMLRLLVERRDNWKLYYSMLLQPDVFRIAGTLYASLQTEYLKMLEIYYENAGCEAPRIDAKLFYAVLEGIFLNYVFSPDTYTLDDLEDALINRYIRQK